jgi:hypothetical protein
MGLTIHYTLKTKLTDPKEIIGLVRQMRELACDLPFAEVGKVVDVRGAKCDYRARRDELDVIGDTAKQSILELFKALGDPADYRETVDDIREELARPICQGGCGQPLPQEAIDAGRDICFECYSDDQD